MFSNKMVVKVINIIIFICYCMLKLLCKRSQLLNKFLPVILQTDIYYFHFIVYDFDSTLLVVLA